MKFQFQFGTIKRDFFKFKTAKDNQFQFQFGTIKRRQLCSNGHLYVLFQFQFGTIKRLGISKDNLITIDVSIPVWYD